MKKVSTIAKLSTIARKLAKDNPDEFRRICNECEPTLKNLSLIPSIHSTIKEQFPDMDRTDESILFAATVYFAYAPSALESSDLERAPNGIRQQMCKVMGWNNAPVVNHYAQIAGAYIKGRQFKERVHSILMGFERFSVKSNQISLF